MAQREGPQPACLGPHRHLGPVGAGGTMVVAWGLEPHRGWIRERARVGGLALSLPQGDGHSHGQWGEGGSKVVVTGRLLCTMHSQH